MAGIDRIYVSSVEEWKTFHDWAKENESKCSEEFNDSLLDHFYMDNEDDVAEWLNSRDSIPCTSMSEACDYFLIKHCPIEFVQERLQQQYSSEYDNIKQGIHKPLTIDYPSLHKFKILDKTSKIRFGDYAGRNKKSIKGMYTVDVRSDNDEDAWWWDITNNRWVNTNKEVSYGSIISTCHTYTRTLKSLKRFIRNNFKLPKGVTLIISGPYVGQNYTIKV